LLAQLSARGVPQADDALVIRPWRQVELPALMRLYTERFARASGPFVRTEPTWRWLVSRQDVDHLFVAIEGPDKFDWQAAELPIVGYMLMKDDRVLELVGADRQADVSELLKGPRPSVAEQLLARACAESIERDDYNIKFHAPADDRLHQLFRAAGGEIPAADYQLGESFLIKIFDLPGLIRRLAPVLQRRLVDADGPRSAELVFCVGDARWRLNVSRRGVKFGTGPLGRNYIRLDRDDLVRLLMGQLDLEQARLAGQLKASSRGTLRLAQSLFPVLPYWRAPWDDIVT
jgi:hypothetical protein